MRGSTVLALAVWAAIAGAAQASIVEGKSRGDGANAGGLEVPAGSGDARLECWQGGRRIIASLDRSRLAFGYASRPGNAVVRLPDGKSATVSLDPWSETYCVVLPRG